MADYKAADGAAPPPSPEIADALAAAELAEIHANSVDVSTSLSKLLSLRSLDDSARRQADDMKDYSERLLAAEQVVAKRLVLLEGAAGAAAVLPPPPPLRVPVAKTLSFPALG